MAPLPLTEDDLVVPGLRVMGEVRGDGVPDAAEVLVLLGPSVDFWDVFTASPEWRDDAPDPIDRWSRRIIGQLAQRLNGIAHFPFDGPPYAPFLSWALASGRAWSSPLGMLVHDTTGLMVSYRGAIALSRPVDLSRQQPMPCEDCTKPCVTACPVDALGPNGYDTQACHGFLETPDGADCLTHGCKARRACPVSAGAGRVSAQSAHHMRYFHPGEVE